MVTSQIPALKRALHERLQQRESLRTVQVSYGAPLPVTDEYLWLGDVDPWDQEPRTSARRRDETFQLWAIVRVRQSGSDQAAVTERAFAIADEISKELNADPTVGGTVLTAEVGGQGGELREIAEDTERKALLFIPITCRARI